MFLHGEYGTLSIGQQMVLCSTEMHSCSEYSQGLCLTEHSRVAVAEWFKSGILPLLKHACGESDRLLCWLYTPAERSHQR